MNKIIDIGTIDDAFSSGGNRLCFVDSSNQARCIKLALEHRSAEIKRAEKSFPNNLRSLAYFDENISDEKVYQRISSTIGDEAYTLIARCNGFVETNLGRGLSYEMIRDSDGDISMTLLHYVWQYGATDDLQVALDHFMFEWARLGMPSRNILLHNIVVQRTELRVSRLIVIDGLGWPDLIPLGYFCKYIARKKAKRKVARLPSVIQKLLDDKAAGRTLLKFGVDL